MKRATREKLRASWTVEKREAARARALARMAAMKEDLEDLPVPVLAETAPQSVADPDYRGDKRQGGEVREATDSDGVEGLSSVELDSRGGQKVLRVVRVPFNPRMVECGGESGCENVLVHVGRNVMFAIGDLLLAKPLIGQEGCWEFVRMANSAVRVDHVGLPVDKRRWEVAR